MPEHRSSSHAPKVMDITHPRHVQPATTSRPVIVTNRPMLPEDPMINKAALSAIRSEKSTRLQKDSAPASESDQKENSRQGKTIMPVASHEKEQPLLAPEAEQEKPNHSIAPDVTSAPEAPLPLETSPVPQALEEPSGDGKTQTEEFQKAESATPKSEEAPLISEPAKDDETEPFQAATETVLDEGDRESKEAVAETRRQEKLEEIIAAGTYHVPIGQMAKRRGRIAVSLVLIVVLLLVAADLVLDAGLLNAPGIPHTSFF